MISNKIEINIDKVINENYLERENLISKFKHLYDEYCDLEEKLEKESKNLSIKSTNLKKENEEKGKYIKEKQQEFSNFTLLEKKELNRKLELDLQNIKLEYKKIKENFKIEIKNANFFQQFLWIFTNYPKKKEKEIELNYTINSNNLKIENEKNINNLDLKEQNYLKKLKEENKEIFHLLNVNEKKIENIKNRIEIIKKELYKLSVKKEFIKCGDKDKYNDIYNEMKSMLNLDLYPSIKRINDIHKDIKNFIIKYQNKITLLEDSDIKEMINNYNHNALNADNLKPQFIKKELKRTNNLLSNIDGKSLDNQQRTAVITNEDNNLVIAGAGSGKTLTISAKVKYLVSQLHINPKEILLITFTKKAAEEMQERITKKLGIGVKVKTFHALGYDLLGFFENKKPEIFEDIDSFTNKFINKTVLENHTLRENIFKYFTTYMNDYVNPENFDSLGEFYRANKSNSLEAIEFKLKKLEINKDTTDFNQNLDYIKEQIKNISKEKTLESSLNETQKLIESIKEQIKIETNKNKTDILTNILEEINIFKNELKQMITNCENDKKIILQKNFNEKIDKLYQEKRTLKWEKVKSIEELIIANYLFSCGIKYIYEGNYKYDTADKTHRQYKPDFYLPDYDLYIEHFGINEEGRCPQYSKIEEIKYLEGINWKRKLHEENKTKMEETYSFEHKKGQLINKLNSILKKYNIPIKKLSSTEIREIIRTLNTDNEFKEFYKLLNTFLSLFKSCNFTENDIKRFLNETKQLNNDYIREKHTLFLNIFKEYYLEYTKELNRENKIDFSDMINKATNYIEEKYLPYEFNFKYIIIDEFQDISVARYKLINAIKKATNARVMAVGDDWQSIYRFAGSEISIFTKFSKYFGETETLMIEKTYRNSQQLINIAGKFVMNNPEQIKKNLKSDKILKKPVILVDYSENVLKSNDENKNSLARRILSILSSFDKTPKNILLLGRNNFDIKSLSDSEFFRVLNKNGETIIETNLYPHLNIKFMSVHKSKGIEADEVIIINNKNDLTGFPNKMVSDSILKYVTTDEELFTFAEERRLFYVALTRTKNHCYLMCPDEYSNFIEELKSYENIEYIKNNNKEEKINCPICKTGYLVKRKGTGEKIFYSCSNSPQCSFKTSDMTNIKSKVRCPSCGNFMTLKKGPYGEFYGCNSYPNCKTTYSIEEFNKLDKIK